MITQTSGSVKNASENVSQTATENLEQVSSDFSPESHSFAGGGLPPNNPNDSKNNPIQRSSQSLKKINTGAQRQKIVQSVQRRYGNSYAARLVATYNNSNNSNNKNNNAAGTIQKKPADTPQVEPQVRVHLSSRPGVINRACCSECEAKENQIQRSFDAGQPVVTHSEFVEEAALDPIQFPAKSPELIAAENGETAAPTDPTTKTTPTTSNQKLAQAKAASLKAAAARPTIQVENVAPKGKAAPSAGKDDVPTPEKGRELFAATFKEAQKTVAPLHAEDNQKWERARASHPQLANVGAKSLKIQPTLAADINKAAAPVIKPEQITNTLGEQNKAVAERAMEGSRTALGKLGDAGAFFMPSRTEFVNDTLVVSGGMPVQRTPLAGAPTSLGMEKIAQKEQQRRQRVEAMVSQFLAANSGKGQEILNAAAPIPGQIMSQAASAKGQLNAALGQTLGTISQEFESAKAQVASQAQATLQTITQQHSQALTKIQAATQKAAQYLVTARQAAATELQTKMAKEEEVFNQTYAKWQPKFKEEGDKVGQEATQKAEAKAKEYESKKINRDDNIFDGPLTDNRMDARAKAARQVGESYSKSMQEEGTKQAAKMMEGKAKDIENLRKEVGEKVNKSLDECVTKANEDIKKAETEIIKVAQETQTKLTEAVNTNSQKTQEQLSSAQASSTQQANTIAQQISGQIDQTANGASQSISQGANQAAQKVGQSLAQFSQSLRGSTAPDEAAMSAAIAQAQGQISSMVAEITGKLVQSGQEVGQGLNKLAQQGATSLKGVEQQATEQAKAVLEGFSELVTQLTSAAIEGYTEIAKAHEDNATQRSEFIKEQYKEVFKALDECFTKINTEMDQGFSKSVTEFGQALRDYMNGSSADALIPLIEKHAEEAAGKVEPRWLTVLKIIVAIVVSIVVAVVLGPAVIGAIGAFAGALGASAAVAGAIGAIVGGAIVGAIGGALSQLANNVISNLAGIKTDLLDGVLESFISGAVGGAIGGAGGLLIKAGASFMKSFAIELGSDLIGSVVGDNVANLAMGKPLEFNLSPMDVALSVLTTGLTHDKVMNKIPGLENFQNKGMEFGQNFGSKVGNSFKPDLKISTPDMPAPKLPDVKTPEIKGATPRGLDSGPSATPKGIDVPKLGDITGPKIGDVGKPGGLGKPDVNAPKSDVATPKPDGDKGGPATKPTPESESSGGGNGPGKKDKPLMHDDVPEINPETEPYVVGKTKTADGEHQLKVLKDGRIARCSTCGELSVAYGVELSLSAGLKAELNAAKNNPDVNAKLAAATRIEAQLKVIQDLRLLAQANGIPPAGMDTMIRRLDTATNVPAIIDFVNKHGLKNAVTAITNNTLVNPTTPPPVNTREGAYTALANEIKLRPNGQAPTGAPAANPPVQNYGAIITKLKLEALDALQKRMVSSTMRQLNSKIKDWETLLHNTPDTERPALLQRLGLGNEMPTRGQLKLRVEQLLKKSLDVKDLSDSRVVKLEEYFTNADVDTELARMVKDKLDNIDPKSPAGVELLKKIKQDFYKKNLVGPTGNAVAFKKLLTNLGLSSSTFNSKYKSDKVLLRKNLEDKFDLALNPNPLTQEDIEFLTASQKDTDELDAKKDSVHSNLQKMGVVLDPLLGQAGDKAKLEGFLRIPIPDGSGVGMGFIGLRVALQGEHDIEFNENKPKDTKDTRAENVEVKVKDRTDRRDQLGPAGHFVPKAGDGLGKQLKENVYKVRAEIALTGGYQAIDITKGYKKLFDAGGEGGFYIEAESNISVQRALELISFGVQRRLLESKIPLTNNVADMVWGKPDAPTQPRTTSQKARDWFKPQKWRDWYDTKQKNGRQWEKDFRKTFSDKEYVETGGLVNGFGSGDVTSSLKLKGNLKYTGGKRYTKQTMKALMDAKGITDANIAMKGRQQNIGRNIHTIEGAIDGTVGPFAFGGKVKVGALEKQIKDPGTLQTKIDTAKTDLETAKTDLATAKAATPPDAAVIGQLQKDVENAKKSYDALIMQQKLLQRQLFNIEGEISGQSRGGNLTTGNPADIAAVVLNASGLLATQIKTFVTRNKSQYAKDNKIDHVLSDAFTTLPGVVDAAVLSHLKAGGANWALKGASGLKITVKSSLKQDFALADKGGMWYEPSIGKAPFKFEILIEEVGNVGIDSVLGGIVGEKSSRLIRLGFKYKEGNWTLMDDSIVGNPSRFTKPRATNKNTLPPPAAPVVTPPAAPNLTADADDFGADLNNLFAPPPTQQPVQPPVVTQPVVTPPAAPNLTADVDDFGADLNNLFAPTTANAPANTPNVATPPLTNQPINNNGVQPITTPQPVINPLANNGSPTADAEDFGAELNNLFELPTANAAGSTPTTNPGGPVSTVNPSQIPLPPSPVLSSQPAAANALNGTTSTQQPPATAGGLTADADDFGPALNNLFEPTTNVPMNAPNTVTPPLTNQPVNNNGVQPTSQPVINQPANNGGSLTADADDLGPALNNLFEQPTGTAPAPTGNVSQPQTQALPQPNNAVGNVNPVDPAQIPLPPSPVLSADNNSSGSSSNVPAAPLPSSVVNSGMINDDDYGQSLNDFFEEPITPPKPRI